MIIIGYAGIGKSTLAKKSANSNEIATGYKDANLYVDLESSNFYIDGKRPNNWHIMYCNIAEDLSRQGYIVFVSCHQQVREYLKEHSNERVLCCIPSLELKDAWIRKLYDRYISSNLEKDFRAYENSSKNYEQNIQEILDSGIELLVLNDIYYNLKDEIEKIQIPLYEYAVPSDEGDETVEVNGVEVKFNSVDEVNDFVRICSKYDCDINIYDGTVVVDAKSFLGVNSLSLGKKLMVKAISSNEDIIVQFMNDIERFRVKDEV